MALSNNTIYWPGNNGITVRAYRGFFKDANPTNTPQRVRIVVEGEVATDLEIMENGEWRIENGEWRMENGEWRMTTCVSIWITVFSLSSATALSTTHKGRELIIEN